MGDLDPWRCKRASRKDAFGHQGRQALHLSLTLLRQVRHATSAASWLMSCMTVPQVFTLRCDTEVAGDSLDGDVRVHRLLPAAEGGRDMQHACAQLVLLVQSLRQSYGW